MNKNKKVEYDMSKLTDDEIMRFMEAYASFIEECASTMVENKKLQDNIKKLKITE